MASSSGRGRITQALRLFFPWLAYSLAYPFLEFAIGPGVAALALFPAGATAWQTSFRGGIVAGLVAAVVNTILLALTRPLENPLVVFQGGGAAGSVVIVVAGAAIGYLSQLRRHLASQNERLDYLARHDALTGLLNRPALELSLADVLATSAASGRGAVYRPRRLQARE